MKKVFVFTLLAALLLSVVPRAQAQQLKIGTVDMKRVFESYYKTKEAEQKINEARNQAKKELEDRMETYKTETGNVQKLNDEIARPELSKGAKEEKSKLRNDKIEELKKMELEIREFQQNREKQLQESTMRMRATIVDQINKIVADRVKADSFDLVLDRSGQSLNGVPIILYAKESFDFTDPVITALNKDRGTDSEPPAATPATPLKGTSPATGTGTTKKPK